jgi:hypothetical protein
MPVWGRYVALATDHEQDAAASLTSTALCGLAALKCDSIREARYS